MVRTTNESVYTLPYWNGHPYTVEGSAYYEQCVWYVMGRVGERLGYPMTNWEKMPSCSPNPAWNGIGVRDAKYWVSNARWVVSNKPRVDSVVALDGNRGHVAYIEEDFGNGIYGISQYNKNSDRKFHYEKVDLSGSKLYGMKILGYLLVPVDDVKRDETKHQFKVIVSQLRIRTDHNTNSDILRVANYNELFNVFDEYNDGTYKWYKTNDGWIATKEEWIEDYPIVDQNTVLSENKELKMVNSNLRNMLSATETELAKTREEYELVYEKLKKIKEIVV